MKNIHIYHYVHVTDPEITISDLAEILSTFYSLEDFSEIFQFLLSPDIRLQSSLKNVDNKKYCFLNM